ncbi:MAG: nitrous oxide reductase accessory protein NosL [Deltaproteobacteria bacterium]|nr:nitrous oxide reductase accessory protein NosL [Deltaproteobacteria bacterium]
MMRKFGLCLPLLFLAAASCEAGRDAEPIQIGHDACSTCRMTIVDDRYGGEVISAKGKVFKFDTLECLSQFHSRAAEKPAASFAVHFAHPGRFLRLDDAVVTHAPSRTGPMGSSLVAFQSVDEARAVLNDPAIEPLSWQVYSKTP